MSARAARLIDAARHVRTRQALFRARRLVPPRLLAAGIDERDPPDWRPLAAGLGVEPAPQAGPQDPPHITGHVLVPGGAIDAALPTRWTNSTAGLLGLFVLHGFEELARYAAGQPDPEGDRFWCGQVREWLETCRHPALPAWHPHPMSVRLLSWCAALSRDAWLPRDLVPVARRSVYRQARVLRRCVEHDIGGNHVLDNGFALMTAGACCGDDAMLRGGTRLLEREIARQILSDGGHEERSPAYHRTLTRRLGDVLAVLSRAGVDAPEELTVAHGRMERWIDAMTGPDGMLPLLNDAWSGPPRPRSVRDPVSDLESTGYVVIRDGEDMAVLDVGELAPRHLPPHAHADCLSFVLWLDGRPLVEDPGTGAYTGPYRNVFRGTAMHATVMVDGADQCDLYGDFRAAFLPRVARGEPVRVGAATVLTAAHDGYRRLSDPAVHERTFVWLPGSGLVVVDRLLAREPHDVTSRVPLADGADPARVSALWGDVTFQDTTRSPYLGAVGPGRAAIWRSRVAPGDRFGWAILRAGASASLDGDELSIHGRGGETIRLVLGV